MNKPILKSTEAYRQGFKRYLNPFMLTLWRLGLGKVINASPEYGGRLMVLTHIGRKSGIRRHQPLNYAIVDGEIYCTAGFGAVSDWYKNILANPNVEVWLPDGWWAGMAEDVTNSPNRLKLLRAVIIASGLAGYAAGLDAKTISDTELELAAKDYRLIHIHRTQPCTGKDGPGDFAWVWQVATLGLMTLLLVRRNATPHPRHGVTHTLKVA